MKHTQHAPAPWDVRAQWDGHGVDYYLINPEQDEKSMDEIYANARLIAAAPELLEALEAVEFYFIDKDACSASFDSETSEPKSPMGEVWIKVRAAINKARGQS